MPAAPESSAVFVLPLALPFPYNAIVEFERLSRSPYDLTRCALVFSQFPGDGTDRWTPAREILPAQHARLHVIDDEKVLGFVHQGETTEDGKERFLATTSPSRARHLAALKSRVAWQFHLDADLRGFYRKAQRHSLDGPLIRFDGGWPSSFGLFSVRWARPQMTSQGKRPEQRSGRRTRAFMKSSPQFLTRLF
jgi:hypothetical protein